MTTNTDIKTAKPGEVWEYSWGSLDNKYKRKLQVIEIDIDNETITGIPNMGPKENNKTILKLNKYTWSKISDSSISSGGGRRKSKRRKSKRRKTRRRRN